MATIKMVWFYLEKFSLGIWGLTIIDLIAITDLEILGDLSDDFKMWFALVGFLYLVIQLPFRVLSLISKRKSEKLENSLKRQELRERKKRLNELEKVDKELRHLDDTHEIIKRDNKKKK